MGNILFIAEHENGKLKGYSRELAGKAHELAGQAGGKAIGCLLGKEVAGLAEQLGAFGIEQAYALEGATLEPFLGDIHARALLALIEKIKPQIILASASTTGKDILPRLAMKLKAGLTTDCVDLKIEAGKLKARRPIFAGKALMDVSFNSDVQLATARPNSFPIREAGAGKKASVEKIPANVGGLRVKVKEVKQAEAGMKDLTEAEIIISGGRALGSSENFKVVRELAEVLGATVGASRAAVDAGYISHDHQVGQTGKTVNPKLYIACGISGAIQHLAGMRTSKVIVAINKDPEAPIFSKADYGIVGDLFQILPILTVKFKELLGK
ncbi:MAG: electron transfer flavoprotein subunit alpha/FixB family protein [Deltaproteobacteria bacterium]|nr:electron transfer flavoprotein subunit alpha/FixB family protein [Deltaproteobacteria bacterium]